MALSKRAKVGIGIAVIAVVAAAVAVIIYFATKGDDDVSKMYSYTLTALETKEL